MMTRSCTVAVCWWPRALSINFPTCPDCMSGEVVSRDALVISTRLVARGPFLGSLGLTPKEHPSGMGEYIEVDPTGQTGVAGVWAAGNITDPAAQVGGSAAAGAFAGARINADLVEEETLAALEE